MAGLAAAARARELGAEPVVLEKGDRPGGSMLLSSGVVWRYRSLEDFQAECPGGDPALQRVVFEQLDEALEWLESLGAPVKEHGTGNPRTIGKRFDTGGLTEALMRVTSHSSVRLLERGQTPLGKADILSTGGFAARLAREQGLGLRANPWSEGDGLDSARESGATTTGDLHEFYGRFAEVVSEDGSQSFDGDPGWSETHLVQVIASWPGGRAWYRVHEDNLDELVRERTVGEMIDAARKAGAVVRDEPPYASVLVQASVTQTLGGIQIDERARVVGAEGLYAAGADVGGISTGGYSSGLAAALVFGRIAAESALS